MIRWNFCDRLYAFVIKVNLKSHFMKLNQIAEMEKFKSAIYFPSAATTENIDWTLKSKIEISETRHFQ